MAEEGLSLVYHLNEILSLGGFFFFSPFLTSVCLTKRSSQAGSLPAPCFQAHPPVQVLVIPSQLSKLSLNISSVCIQNYIFILSALSTSHFSFLVELSLAFFW